MLNKCFCGLLHAGKMLDRMQTIVIEALLKRAIIETLFRYGR